MLSQFRSRGLTRGYRARFQGGRLLGCISNYTIRGYSWPTLSRLDDKEIKMLMIDVVQKTYELIQELFDAEKGGQLLLLLAARDPLPRWEDPR